MKLVFLGASSLTVSTARMLIRQNHDVVIIEKDKERIDSLQDELDCGFVHGDGTRPDILREVMPREADVLFCLTDNDQNNILASLVGRSLGFTRVITQIGNSAYEPICLELGLTETIIPDRAIALTLTDLVAGQTTPELTSAIKGDARLYSFLLPDDAKEVRVRDMDLPGQVRMVCAYRGEELILPYGDTVLKPKDQIVLITHEKQLPKLQEKWGEGREREK